MKRKVKTLLIAAFLIIAPLFMFAQTTENNPPLPGDVPTNGTGKVGSAPVGNGTFILLTLAAAFAIRKTYILWQVKDEEETE